MKILLLHLGLGRKIFEIQLKQKWKMKFQEKKFVHYKGSHQKNAKKSTHYLSYLTKTDTPYPLPLIVNNFGHFMASKIRPSKYVFFLYHFE